MIAGAVGANALEHRHRRYIVILPSPSPFPPFQEKKVMQTRIQRANILPRWDGGFTGTRKIGNMRKTSAGTLTPILILTRTATATRTAAETTLPTAAALTGIVFPPGAARIAATGAGAMDMDMVIAIAIAIIMVEGVGMGEVGVGIGVGGAMGRVIRIRGVFLWLVGGCGKGGGRGKGRRGQGKEG